MVFKAISTFTETHPRIVRYEDLVPCTDAFIDTRTPGSDKKENFTIIGPGVSENPNQFVHIPEPHGFNIGGARQPAHCVNSQHSHDTAEVFYVHSGTWAFRTGETGGDAEVILHPGDLISIPTGVFRGFENVGDSVGYLWAVLGGDDPGKVLWAPYVFDMAKDYGLVLLENGSLVDTGKGESVSEGQTPMPVTSKAQVEALSTFTNQELRQCCIMASEEVPSFSRGGLTKRTLISSETKLGWPHGFSLMHMSLTPSASADQVSYPGTEVLFVHSGELTVKFEDETWCLFPGDTASVPKGLARQFVNRSDKPVEFLRVRGDI
ncbi:MAG: cupin domain-containing protein [Maricaulaceae bacterium]